MSTFRSEAAVRAVAFWLLLAVTGIQGLCAVGGGIALLGTDGMGMSSSVLGSGPFQSFLWPGLILLLVIGGTQTLAAILLIARKESALLWSAIAGLGMLIWIFVEVGIIRESSWLQVLFFVMGILQLALVFALAGLAGWLPRIPLSTGHDVNGEARR